MLKSKIEQIIDMVLLTDNYIQPVSVNRIKRELTQAILKAIDDDKKEEARNAKEVFDSLPEGSLGMRQALYLKRMKELELRTKLGLEKGQR